MSPSKGFSSLALIIIAVLVLAGGYWVWKGKATVSVSTDQLSAHESVGEPYIPCDNDEDDDCDRVDYELLIRALGKCAGEGGFNFSADVDRDGCVTEDDVNFAFPDIPVTSDPKKNLLN